MFFRKLMKKLFMALAIVLIVGVVFVFAQNKSWYGHKGWKKGGEHNFDKSVWLEKLGLDPDASEEEIIEAKKALWGKEEWQGKAGHIWGKDKAAWGEGKENHNWEEEKAAWLEKMGLPADASEEEIIAAKKELWGDKEFYHGGCSECPFRKCGKD